MYSALHIELCNLIIGCHSAISRIPLIDYPISGRLAPRWGCTIVSMRNFGAERLTGDIRYETMKGVLQSSRLVERHTYASARPK